MTLLVGISNPETAEELVRLADRIERVAPSRILLAHVVTVASQISLSTGRSSPEVIQARDFLQEIADDARDAGIDTRAVVEVARSVEDGLLAAADSHDAARILVGYTDLGAPASDDTEDRFDRTIRRVARKARADVIVAKFRHRMHSRILVPVTVDAPLSLTGLLCRALTGEGGASASELPVTFLHVSESDVPVEQVRASLQERLDREELGSMGDLKVIGSDDAVEDAVVRETGHNDLVVLGPSGRPGLLDRVFSSRARRIAERVPASVILAWGPP